MKKNRKKMRRRLNYERGKVAVTVHKGDVLFNGTVFEYPCKLVATDATEEATRFGYTIEEFDEPTANLTIYEKDMSNTICHVPIFGKVPSFIDESTMKHMVREELMINGRS